MSAIKIVYTKPDMEIVPFDENILTDMQCSNETPSIESGADYNDIFKI